MRSLMTVSWTLLYLINILNVSWSPTDAQTYDNMTILKRTLLTGYDKDLIPVLNLSHELNVTVTFSLTAIPEVDTVHSIMKLRAFLYCTWTDEKLTWIPAHYGDIREMSLLANTVWTPPLILGSGVTLENVVNSWQKVYINHNGFLQVALGGTFTNICGFTMAFWPFDKQACNLFFVPVNSGAEKLKFVFPSNPIHDLDLIPMGEWTYDKISVSYQGRFELTGKDITYTVKIRRQSTFYVLTMILPMYCVSFLGLLVFVIPCDSGERVGFGVTIMLSMVVFMMVIKDEVPKSSEPLPYICIFINVLVLFAFLSNIINLFSLSLFHRNEAQPVGQKCTYFVKLFLRFSERKSTKPVDKENNNKGRRSDLSSTSKEQFNDILQTKREGKLEPPIGEDFISKENVKQEMLVTWRDVSKALDRLILVTAMPLAVVVTISGVIYLLVASDYPDWAN